MMRIELSADQRFWLRLPPRGEDAGGVSSAAWEDGVIATMRPTWGALMTAEVEAAVRGALHLGRSRVLDSDALTLQFWPTTSVVNAIVHISAYPLEVVSDERHVPLDDGMRYVVRPRIEPFMTPHLGEGTEARYLGYLDEVTPRVDLAGINYLFENSRAVVSVVLEPTLPAVLSLVGGPLRELVSTIRVVAGEGEEPWRPATIDRTLFVPFGDAWQPVEAPTAAADSRGAPDLSPAAPDLSPAGRGIVPS